jgi:hypothetical protein
MLDFQHNHPAHTPNKHHVVPLRLNYSRSNRTGFGLFQTISMDPYFNEEILHRSSLIQILKSVIILFQKAGSALSRTPTTCARPS